MTFIRPLQALRRGAGGPPERIAVRSDRGGLKAGWDRGERAILSDKQKRQRQEAAAARLERPNRRGGGSVPEVGH